jgi:hypothetical protein
MAYGPELDEDAAVRIRSVRLARELKGKPRLAGTPSPSEGQYSCAAHERQQLTELVSATHE